MGSMEAVIGLDLKLCATKAVCGLKRADADAGVGNGRLEKLEQSVRSLEEERKKIEVFRRELPLCMRILTDVIEGLQKEMEQCREEGRYKEFPPVKREFEKEGEASAEKINWMSSAQLWSNSDNSGEPKQGRWNNAEKILEGQQQPEKKSLFFESKSRRGTGAFVPFKGLKAHVTSVALAQKEKLSGVPGRPLLSPIKSAPLHSSTAVQDHQVFSRVVNRAPATPGAHLGLQTQQPPSRKARRCWSPELHRRFVLALKQLGGAQVATPKQIRELMKVDALTNDEVKSHLQKYRMHSQRVHSASAATKFPVVAVAGSWDTAPENCSISLGQSLTQSGSPQSPLQLASSHHRDSCEENGKSESSI